MIEIRNLTKKFERSTPLNNVSVTINDGDVISLIGPSGAGKSTFLRCINLLDRPTSGQIIVNGTDITSPDCKINEVRRKMGMVFQSFNLFGHMTVLENVMCGPMDLKGMSKQEAYDRAIGLLRLVGLETRAANMPDMLSGGQKQRVAIARTLSMDPDIILFDEPTSALDPTMVGEVQAVIRELARRGKTMMIVTHEMKFAREICNRVFYLDQGGIYDDGTPEQIFDDPQKELTRRFIRHIKVFEAKLDKNDSDFVGVVSDIQKYGYMNLISPKLLYRIQLVFEELVRQIILPPNVLGEITLTIEYDEKNEKADMEIKYSGSHFDPRNTDNSLSWKIIDGFSEKIDYSPCSDAEYSNRIRISLKKAD